MRRLLVLFSAASMPDSLLQLSHSLQLRLPRAIHPRMVDHTDSDCFEPVTTNLILIDRSLYLN